MSKSTARKDRPEPMLSDESMGIAPGRNRLTGRRIVVVGAGTRASADPEAPIGNGRAIAVLAAREGAAVACVDVNRDAAEETARLVRSEGAEALVVHADVSDPDACARLITESARAFSGIDGVVANVGIGLGGGLARTTAEQWDTVFDVNIRSHFLIAQAAMPLLPEGGSLVLISSIAGLKPGSRLPAYDASKAAVFGLCRSIAAEGARNGIRANVVVPGLVDTPLGRAATEGRPSRSDARIPMRRQATAWDVAYATLFLLSGESAYITGQSIVVDGGMTQLG